MLEKVFKWPQKGKKRAPTHPIFDRFRREAKKGNPKTRNKITEIDLSEYWIVFKISSLKVPVKVLKLLKSCMPFNVFEI